MIRMFGAACAALLIFAASAVASPEVAEAQDVRPVRDASLTDAGDTGAVAWALIKPPVPPEPKNDADKDDAKTQDEIKAEKDVRRATIKSWKEMIESLEKRWELLMGLLAVCRGNS